MQSSHRVTRRALARLLAATPFAPSVSAPAQPPPLAGDAVSAGRAQFQNAARQLAAVKLPRNIEPATHFEA